MKSVEMDKKGHDGWWIQGGKGWLTEMTVSCRSGLYCTHRPIKGGGVDITKFTNHNRKRK